jgi:DNA-binding transcriptional LysR family regulator
MRHLRALIAVAEELNFTRAADRLHLTQQALSGQIRQLEERVGTQLVERDPRRVALTPAGQALYDRARPLLAGTEQAVEAARAAAGEQPRLTVGYVAPLTRRMVTPAMELFTKRRPDVEIVIHFASFLDPWGGLRDGSADVAYLYGQFEHDGLDLELLFSEPRGIALPTRHPLAAKSEVTLEEFIAEPLVDVPMTDPVCRDFWIGARHRGGKPPRLGASVQTLDAMIEAISAGLGVAGTVAPAVDALGARDDVVFRPVPGLDPLDFFAARRTGDDRGQVTDFIKASVDALAA